MSHQAKYLSQRSKVTVQIQRHTNKLYVTGDVFLVEGDVGAMRPALTWYERDFEL